MAAGAVRLWYQAGEAHEQPRLGVRQVDVVLNAGDREEQCVVLRFVLEDQTLQPSQARSTEEDICAAQYHTV